LAPLAEELCKQLGLHDASLISVSSDTPNRKSFIIPIMVWFLHPISWIEVKLLEVHSVEGETSDIIVNAIVNWVRKFNIEDMCFWGDNTNSNFDGAQHRGKHNVLTQLRNLRSINVLRIGCGAHIIHNCIQQKLRYSINQKRNCSCQGLQIFLYIHRATELQNFCDKANVKYNKILQHGSTRFLSSMIF
jgi:hypothetical protein